MRELVLSCALALLGGGCVEVVSHIDEYDAGPPDIKSSDANSEPEASGGQCTSGQRWTGGSMASAVMTPGRPCIGSGCHTPTSKTAMTMAGTIYPKNGLHDENDCNGLDGAGGAIVLMDENGMELAGVGRVQINNVGNFYTGKQLPPTYKVKFLYMGREAVMKAPITGQDSNCNSCHSPEGFMQAEGRIYPTPP